jgi:DeoD family purine-nucleoside phosphorylase
LPSYWGISPSFTQRLTVPTDTPAREATSARVGSLGADSADSLVVDVAIIGSLKSLAVEHGDAVQQTESQPSAARRNDGSPPASQHTPPPTTPGTTPTPTPTPTPEANTIHLRPTATLAERVLLPGDPGRALALAQFLLESPLMFNHHRGLWGYTGKAPDGEPLTIQSTGMGGPSAAIVLHELISLGVTRAIRVGTCGALDPGLGLGDLVVAREAIAADGTSAALGVGSLAYADPALADALARGAGSRRERAHREGRIVTTDLFYERDSTRNAKWQAEGALAVEMEAATLFALGANAGIQVACLLAVSDNLHHPNIQPPDYNPGLDVNENIDSDIQSQSYNHAPGPNESPDPSIQPQGYNSELDGSDLRIRIDDHALTQAAEAMGSIALAALST